VEETYLGWEREARGLGQESAFVAAHPSPFLIVYDPLVSDSSILETGKYSALRVYGVTPERPKVDAEVHRVAKAPRVGNLSAGMVTVGRAGNNDVILRDDSISNFQAYFTLDAGVWHVSDAESSNGTRVDGQLIGRATALGENVALSFGNIRCRFLLPGAFFRLLTEEAPA
jgi:hypothetical protein